MSAVSYELDGRVGILTLNRPDSLNAVNPDMVAGLLAATAMTGGFDGIRLRSATSEIAAQLRFTRAQAMATG